MTIYTCTTFGYKQIIQKISSGQTVSDVLNHQCDFEPELGSTAIFSQDTLAYDDGFNQTKFGSKRVKKHSYFWLYKP